MGNSLSTNKPHKIVALVTYCVALVALLLGLLLPFGPVSGARGTDAMWAMQLPQALVKAIPVAGLQNLIGPDVGAPFLYSATITLNGWIEIGYDLGALFTVLYALVVLAGLIALVPAIINTVSKKSYKNLPLKAASFIEVLALAVVSVFVFIQMTALSSGADVLGYQWSWSVVTAFLGTLVILIVQSIYFKKGSGVVKTVLVILSMLALVLGVFDLGGLIPSLNDTLNSMSGETFGKGLYSSVVALLPLTLFFNGTTDVNVTTTIANLSAIEQTVLLLALILGLLAFLNFLLDCSGLGKVTKKFMLISNLARYALTFAVAALVIILPLFIEGYSIGLMGIIFAVLTLIALIINIIRFAKFSKAKKRAKSAAPVAATSTATAKPENGTAPAASPATATGTTAAAAAPKKKMSKKERKAAEKAAAERARRAREQGKKPANGLTPELVNSDGKTAAQPAAVADATAAAATPAAPAKPEEKLPDAASYYGPVDEFILTLSNDEKIEFQRVFLQRQYGQLTFIPAYNVGGNNKTFFNNIFIHYARLRDGMSTGLFKKMYDYRHKM